MEIFEIILLVFVGILSGFLNVVAGGGSLITLPLMIFLGLPPSVANGTNRVAILTQNIFAVSNFSRKGIYEYPLSLYLGVSSVMGSVIGAKLAVDIDEHIFNRIIAFVMVVVAFFIARKRNPEQDGTPLLHFKNRLAGIIVFFLLGIYGGFLHAGIGFLIILALTKIHRFSLVKSNSIKVTVALIYTIPALLVFILNDSVDWMVGIVLAIGTALGGMLGSHFSIKGGDKWIKIILVISIIGMAIKLWFF